MPLRRYAIVGLGGRGLGMFARPLMEDFAATAELAAVCDSNPIRMANAVADLPRPVAQFTDFDEMLRAADPDAVVVTTRDAAHAGYVVRALRAGKRAISEKPLCTTAAQCREILSAVDETGGTCLTTHNARYGAATRLIRDIIRSGRLGPIRFIAFDETLDRVHGADYFRRWHRRLADSGGLQIHKASHHFDAINWWADALPVSVAAQGSLRFYGSNGPFRHTRCRGCPHADHCAFHADVFTHDRYRRMYLDAESADGYCRDGCVFDDQIDIPDQIAALIRYDSGLEVAYSLLAYSPYESQRVIIEGADARLEYVTTYNTGWAIGGKPIPGIEEIVGETVKIYHPAEGVEEVPVERVVGSHGGADPQLRADFFGRDWDAEPNEMMASVDQAVQAVLIGAAVTESIARDGRPIHVQDLLKSG